MIELRWITRKPANYSTGWEKVLQYRQKVDTTFRGGMWVDPHEVIRTANYQWSGWTDVPEVKE